MPDFPYYPNQKYIQKNWAPERISVGDLMAMANAQKLATQQGILTPQLANHLLPIALVEGRFGRNETKSDSDYGLNHFGYPPTPERDAAFKKMGLQVGRFDLPPEASGWGDQELEAYARKQPFYPIIKNDQGYSLNDPEQGDLYAQENAPNNVDWKGMSAKLAALMLAEKAKIYGPDNAVERWNGAGKKVSPSGKTVADSSQYKRKVSDMMLMLQDPHNAALMQAYQGMLK